MNETMQQIVNACVPVLCLLITTGGAYLVALLKKRTTQIDIFKISLSCVSFPFIV